MRFAVVTTARASFLALVLALSACGGDDDPNADDTAEETTATTAAQPPPTDLSLGDTREAVAELQELLRDRGYEVIVTKEFDDQTKKAVEAFQIEVGLPADGVVNAATFDALRNPNGLVATTSPTTSVATTTTSVASTTTTTRPRPGPTRETIPGPDPPPIDPTP